jgi:hypothetical protein
MTSIGTKLEGKPAEATIPTKHIFSFFCIISVLLKYWFNFTFDPPFLLISRK